MTLEAKLSGWTGPSSSTEQEKQGRTERMIRDAISAHQSFSGYNISVYAKGSYPNNTNVRMDSDVDIAVQCKDVEYWREEVPGSRPPAPSYEGPWTPTRFRTEVESALRAKFGDQVHTDGQVAIGISSSSARVDADVVPCFSYRAYWLAASREGTRVFRRNGSFFENYPAQQLANGRLKNNRTSSFFKQSVRVLKRIENEMVSQGVHRELPSFFIECLVYNCPDHLFVASSWTERIKKILGQIWANSQGDAEPADADRWLEVNECKYLYSIAQKWSRDDARSLALTAWGHLGLS